MREIPLTEVRRRLLDQIKPVFDKTRSGEYDCDPEPEYAELNFDQED